MDTVVQDARPSVLRSIQLWRKGAKPGGSPLFPDGWMNGWMILSGQLAMVVRRWKVEGGVSCPWRTSAMADVRPLCLTAGHGGRVLRFCQRSFVKVQRKIRSIRNARTEGRIRRPAGSDDMGGGRQEAGRSSSPKMSKRVRMERSSPFEHASIQLLSIHQSTHGVSPATKNAPWIDNALTTGWRSVMLPSALRQVCRHEPSHPHSPPGNLPPPYPCQAVSVAMA